MHRIGFALCALCIMTACAARTPARSPDPVAELSATVNEFLDAWYIQKDEAKFWSYVSEDSLIRKYDWAVARAFTGAFTVPLDQVDPKNLQLGIEELMEYFEDHPGLLLNPGNVRFAIVRQGVSITMLGSEPEPGDESYEWYSSLKTLEDAGLLYTVIYYVEGEGYNTEILVTFWIRRDSQWELYSFSGFD